MSQSTESIRWRLLESAERCYYTGSTAGQGWLRPLSAFVDSMPRNDRRLIRLAIIGPSPPLDEFIALSPPSCADEFKPSSWLDAYVDWAARPGPGPSGAPPVSDSGGRTLSRAAF